MCDSEERWLLCAVTAVFVGHLRQQALLFNVDIRYEQDDLVVNKDNNDCRIGNHVCGYDHLEFVLLLEVVVFMVVRLWLKALGHDWV